VIVCYLVTMATYDLLIDLETITVNEDVLYLSEKT